MSGVPLASKIDHAGVTNQPQEEPASSIVLQSLCSLERRNVIFLVLGFSCVVAELTLIVGTGALVIQSVGGGADIAPMSLACFFLGMSLVSLTLTHWFFDKHGRKMGFWSGSCMTMVGVTVGVVGLLISSPIVVLVSNLILGAGTGIGMYLRFAAVEVVPQAYASKAITWTLCGGCMAAFVGPEVAASITGVFGDGNRTYLGVFIATASFAALQALFVGLVRFEKSSDESRSENPEKTEAAGEKQQNDETSDIDLISLLKQSMFILPLSVSVLSWCIMAQPMSIFRVAMREFGFTDRQSLTVIELHFLSMYAPGFISGSFINKYGTIRGVQVSIASYLIATAINLSTQPNNNSTAPWFLGLIFLGIGWNFGFSSATVWVTMVYATMPEFKSKVQAANETGTFFLAGAVIFSTGYIYNAGATGLTGWRTLNYVLLGLIALMIMLVAIATRMEHVTAKATSNNDIEANLDSTVDNTALPERSEEIPV
jgi:MFS family permease